MQVEQQDTPQAFGASLWGGRKGEQRIEITVVGNSIGECINALQAAAYESAVEKGQTT